MRLVVSLVFALLFVKVSVAQRVCGTTNYTRDHFFTEVQKPVEVNGPARDTVPNEIITIPVVIHLLFNTNEQNITDAQIRSQIDILNRDFRRLNSDAVNTPDAFKPFAADARIMFCLAQVAPNGRETKGIVRKYTGKEFFLGDDGMKYSAAGGDDAWDTKKYLNIWVCAMFGRSLGYATPPGGQADKDGVVINYDVFGDKGFVRAPFDKGRTATHEVAHWLGLKHIWGDKTCGSDDVDDTPSQRSYNFNCPSFPHANSCSPNIDGDMFMNFMDFTNDACMNMFTNGQKMKMRGLFALNGIRNSFLNSYVCDGSSASGGPLPDDTMPVFQPAAGLQLYPNPVQTEVNMVPYNGFELQGKTCYVYNMQGVQLLQQKMASNKETMDLSSLKAGLYILKVASDAEKNVFKIIKL